MASRLSADFRARVNNREETNSVEIEQQERKTTEDPQKKKMNEKCPEINRWEGKRFNCYIHKW